MIGSKRARYSFEVIGSPVSMQSSPTSRRRYKATVAKAAGSSIPSPIQSHESTRIEIDWFSEGFQNKPDLDNIVKPIQDALKGIVFEDDNQVAFIKARKHDVLSVIRFHEEALSIVDPLLNGHREYIYVRIY